MNRRHITIAAIVLTTLALAIWHGCQKPPHLSERPKPSPDPTGGHIDQQPTKEPTTQDDYKAMIKERSIAFAKRNNAPIAFYGRVVDQDGRPLQGVAVGFRVTAIPMVPVPWGPDETKKGSCVTDQNGLFSVEGMRGVSLSFSSFEKSGYRESGYYHQAHVRYEPYSSQRHIPNRDTPVEFMLIRDDLPKAEQVFDQRLRFNWNAGVSKVDIGSGVGQLEFDAKRAGMDPSNRQKKFEWEVNMHATGFVMSQSLDESVKIAPQTGYASNCRVAFSPDEKTWASKVTRSYAILTHTGEHGVIELTLYSDREDGGVSGQLTLFLNKSGSRNIDHR